MPQVTQWSAPMMKTSCMDVSRGAAIAVAFVVNGCSQAGSNSTLSDAATARVPSVQTVRAVARTVHDTRTFFGSIVAEQQASVAPLVSGRVERRFVERGDRVRMGDPLYRLREGDFRDQSAQAAASLGQALSRSVSDSPEVRAARSAVEVAEESLRRTELLLSQGSASAQELARVRMELSSARSQLSLAEQGARAARFVTVQARAQLSATQRALSDATVRAPFDGEVLERRLDVGDFAQAGAPLLTLLRRDSLRVRFAVGQADSFAIHAGLYGTVSIDGLSDSSIAATIRYVSPAMQEAGRTLTVEATLDAIPERSRGAVLPGQFAVVRVELESTQARVVIPRRATRTMAGVYRAFVMHGTTLDERVLFVPDEPEGDELVVARGIAADEELVLAPTAAMHDGMEVAR